MRRWIPALILVGLALIGILVVGLSRPAQPNTVVLVVLDTVRSDRLGMCGYQGNPTTPTLDAVSMEWAASCDAIAPGSWTLPSHASYFTGVWPSQHGAHSITSGIRDFSGTGARSRPLDKRHATLAEDFRDLGFETALLSANPLLNEGMGLTRGFTHTRVTERFGPFHAEALESEFAELLNELDQEAPWLVVVNIADAHQPWVSRWLPLWSLRPLSLLWHKDEDDSRFTRYITGAMPPEEVSELLPRISQLYDEALWRADGNLNNVLDELRSRGRCTPEDDCRLVVTADHGELLGEHQMLDHGHVVWDENVRVPLLTNVVEELPEGPISALHAYHLLRYGEMGTYRTQSQAWPHVRRCARVKKMAFCAMEAALWKDGRKLVWSDGDYFEEVAGERTPLSEIPLELQKLGEAVTRDAQDGDVDESVYEMLEAAGYID